MKDQDKTHEQPNEDIIELHQQVIELKNLLWERTNELNKANELLKSEIVKHNKTERAFHQITDNMLDMIRQTDTEGIIRYASPSHKSILGYEPEDLLGRSIFELLHPDDRESVRTTFQGYIKMATTWNLEFRYRHADGNYLWLESIGNLLFGDDGQIIGAICCSRDITRRKQAEEALRESEERYRSLFELSPDAIAVHSEDKIIFVNKAGAKLVGAEGPEELIGKSIWNFLHPDYHEIVSKRIRQEFEQGKSVPMLEERVIRLDGSVVDVEVTAAPLKLGGKQSAQIIMRDISERKRIETALEKERQRLFSVLEGFPGLVCLLAPDYSILYANREIRKVFGEFGQKRCFEVAFGKDNPCKVCPLTRVKETKSPVRTEETILSKVYDIYYYPINDLDNTVYVIKVGIDITERKRVEQEMARLDRLSLVGEMAAGIAHEIRNPMTTVRGLLQMLGGKKEYVQHKQYFDLMIEELDRSNSIITEFLSLARNKPEGLKSQQLNSIVRAISPLINADAINSQMEVFWDLTEDLPLLLLNEKEIRQLLLNLARNGLEAMNPGGILTIKTLRDRNNVVLLVQDQGIGIEEDILNKLGTPFLTTKDKGTGLGVAVSYSIAQRHNATVKVETDPTGTTFFIRFKS